MEHKKIAEMYGVLLLLKEEYDSREGVALMSFEDFAKAKVNKLFGQAFEWLVEDERESNEKIAQ